LSNEQNAEVLYELGLAFFAAEKYKKCLKELKSSLKVLPEN
jgi:hypothetical protein